MVVLASFLMFTVVCLSKEKQENQQIISALSQEITQLKERVAKYKLYKDQEEQRLALYRFKRSVFQLRYPEFTKIANIVFKKSKEYKFNPYLVMAIIQVESDFNPYAISNAGAYGLMQINYAVWKNELNINFNRIFDKEYNIDLGLKILKHYYDNARGNIFMALFRYNNGFKYNNTRYNGKIIATKFYANKDKAKQGSKNKNLSI
jgi:soluble lytic murein transglycosylase-like protein